jgi:glycyl-tRNA synthetase beta chain
VLSPEAFAVEDADHYRRELLARGIEVRLDERRRQIRDLLEAAAAAVGGRLRDDNALLELWSAGSEVPGVVSGRFDAQHLKLPREILIASLREGHRAFVVMVGGEISSWFLAPMDRPDDPEQRVQQGNEWGVAALLEDVAFRWLRDRGLPLAERRRRLGDISYVPIAGRLSLGSLGDRSRRVAALAGHFCDELGWSKERELALQAADLLYADATTELVRELPALRGVVGGLLAQGEGYPDSVWQAIYDHALPSTGLSMLPRGRVGTVVALAHWLDQLAAWALIDEDDEGRGREQRRVAADVVRLAVHADLILDLHLASARALRAYRGIESDAADALQTLQPLIDRALEEVLIAEGFARDELRAVLSAAGAGGVAEVVQRLRGLRMLRSEPRLEEVVRSARRLNDVLSAAPESELDPGLLREPAEIELYRVCSESGAQVHTLLRVGRYEDWLERMLEVDGALQRFFAEVLIHDQVDALRANRLALLQLLQRLYAGVVRLAELELPEDPRVAGREGGR